MTTKSKEEILASYEHRIAHSLECCAKWQAEGDSKMESFCARNAAHAFLMVSLRKYESSEESISYLSNSACREQLIRAHTLEKKRWADYKGGAPIEPPHIDSSQIHLAWLIGEFGVANDMIDEIRDPIYMKVYTASFKNKVARFWSEYERSMECLRRKIPFDPQFDEKLDGPQKYWVAYPRLIGAITNGCDLSNAMEEVHKAFQVFQKDKRIQQAMDEDGNPRNSVNWNFRLASILRAKDYYYGTSQ